MIDLHDLFFEICACALCAASAVVDVKKRIIPDVFVLCVTACGILSCAAELCLGARVSQVLLNRLSGAAAAFGIMMISFLAVRGGIGAGDIKLTCALGFVFGIDALFPLLLISFSSAAAFGLCAAAAGRGNLKSMLPMAPFSFVGCAYCCAVTLINMF